MLEIVVHLELAAATGIEIVVPGLLEDKIGTKAD
jgi:hypothetical protein